MFPLQTESSSWSIRNYGCLLMVYAWFVAQFLGRNFTMREIEYAFELAVRAGFIWENDLPVDGAKGKWYRCWIQIPSAWMRLLADTVKKEVDPKLLFNVEKLGEEDIAPFYVIENTYEKKGFKGIHFTGRMQVEQYNPGMTTGLTGIKTVRGWSLGKKG